MKHIHDNFKNYFLGFMLFSFALALASCTKMNERSDSNFNNSYSSSIDSLSLLINETSKTDPDLAMEYCNRMFYLADSLDMKSGVIDAMTKKCRLFINFGMMDSANKYCEEVIQLSEELKDFQYLGTAFYLKGVIDYNVKSPLYANSSFITSYGYYKRVNDSLGLANILNGIGAVYYELGKPDSAAIYLTKCVEIGKMMDEVGVLGKAYLNLGLVYDELDDHPRSIHYFLKSLEINEQLDKKKFVANAKNNMGNVYVQENKLDSAIILYNKSLELSLGLKYLKGCGDAYNGLADIADKRREYSKAREYFLQARKYYSQANNMIGLWITYKNLGMNQEKFGNYKNALMVYDSSLKIAREAGLIIRVAETYQAIYINYAQQGDFENAFVNLEKYLEVTDSIRSLKKDDYQRLGEFYQQEKSKGEILLLKNENLENELALEQRTKQRNIYLFSGSGMVLIFIFFFTYYSQRTRKNRIISEQRINQLEEEKKLLAARSIVTGQEEERKRIARELHDGLGVLLSSAKMHFTTIRDKSPESKPLIDKAAQLLEQATGDVRRISHNMMPGLLTKFGLYEAVEDLFEQVDEMEGIHASVEIEGEKSRMNENTEIMLYRVIQEVVNNTLKYAEAKNVLLKINILQGKLRVEYSDDGKGFDVEEQRMKKSMGLNSIISRVKFLGDEIQIYSAPNEGVTYKFEISV